MTTPGSGTLIGPSVAQHSATMSADGITLLVTAPTGSGSTFLYLYNTITRSWSTVNAPAAQAAVWMNRKAADFLTDPTTGASWFLGGSFPNSSSTNEIDKFQNGAWTAALAATPAAGVSSSTVLNDFSSGTSHMYGSKIYLFGGFSSTSGQRGYQSFQSLPWIDTSTSPPTYGNQLTLGSVPQPRQDHCSVMTVSKKVIIFGGYDANAKVTLQDIWLLDMVTLTWSQIVTTNPTRPIYGHNCNIAGANMVVYGGAASAVGTTASVGYKGIQVYDVMLATWMSSYAPKQDTTPISKPLSGGVGSNSSGGLGVGAIVGIVAGVIVIMLCIAGYILYQRRQKRIENRESELEKEAYLASLGPEGSEQLGMRKSPQSPASAHVVGTPMMSTPGMGHNNPYGDMGELLLGNTGSSPGMGGQGGGQGNVQYLMQHLPDGTIAVQPVYLDHQPMQMQSPNMMLSSADNGGYVSPHMGSSTGGYFSPPPPPNNSYAFPPPSSSGKQQTSQVPYPQPVRDPFASPRMTSERLR
ncbi:hypothetical protein EDD21DRAFT_393125 [Dissophora ornata]|nr:hypothetical protein EDD21DRAFT_393125 [Dissophora ornata]